MKIDITLIGYINTFENITQTNVKDCFYNKNQQLVFIVKEGQGKKAVGKNGMNIRKLERLLHKKLKIIEYSENPSEFMKNIIYPLKSPEIKLEGEILSIKTDSTQLKALLIGREKTNLNEIQGILGKYFNNIKVIIN